MELPDRGKSPNPANPDPRCTTRRASFSQFNDWDGDGIANWDDVDDDGDGIIDVHWTLIGIVISTTTETFTPSTEHCTGTMDRTQSTPTSTATGSKTTSTGTTTTTESPTSTTPMTETAERSIMIQAMHSPAHITRWTTAAPSTAAQDSTPYADAPATDHWNLLFWHNPFADVMLNYNGYDATTSPATPGTVPEFYWFMFARWSPYNGGNEWDIDADGDSLTNGLDTDQDADGLTRLVGPR